jgi:hypothetical protein
MKRRLSMLAAAAALACVPVVATPAPSPVTAKSCRSSYTHAIMPDGSHKCLHAGEFCSRKASYQLVYKSKGFYCPPSRHMRRS